MIVLFIIVAVLCFVLILPFKVQIKYLLYEKTNRLTVKTWVVMPVIFTFDTSKKKVKKNNKKFEEKSTKSKTSFENLLKVFREVAKLFDYFKRKLKITKLKLHFHIGASDAAATGILTGSAWGALYDVVALLENNFSLYEKNVHVAPDFTREVFETDIQIELSIKVFYLLIFGMRTLRRLKRLNILKPERNEN